MEIIIYVARKVLQNIRQCKSNTFVIKQTGKSQNYDYKKTKHLAFLKSNICNPLISTLACPYEGVKLLLRRFCRVYFPVTMYMKILIDIY